MKLLDNYKFDCFNKLLLFFALTGLLSCDQDTNTYYQFTPLKTYVASAYEGRVGRFTGLFYERTVGGGVIIPSIGSSANPSQPPTQDVIIIAQPAR